MQRTETKAKHFRITSLFYLDRFGMDEMNNFLSMRMMRTEMKACEDKFFHCKKYKKSCGSKKIANGCKKTCGLCPKTNDKQGKFFWDNPSSLLSLEVSGLPSDKSKLPAQGNFG